MRLSINCYRFLLVLWVIMLLLPINALAYVYDENISHYKSLPAVEQYMKTMKSPTQTILKNDNIKKEDHRIGLYKGCHNRLRALGYCVSDYDRNRYYSEDYVMAVFLFAQQMGLGDCDNGQKTTPFLRAVIRAEGVAQPVIVAPINHRLYCTKNEKIYSLKEIIQAKSDERVCWKGKVLDAQSLSGRKMRYTISCEGDTFIVDYTRPSRSTEFLKNDKVIVYGRISNDGSAQILADMIAYSK